VVRLEVCLLASRRITACQERSTGLKLDQAKLLKELELENDRLWRVGSDLTLDKLIMKEPARGND
jgi:hypothetical protein